MAHLRSFVPGFALVLASLAACGGGGDGGDDDNGTDSDAAPGADDGTSPDARPRGAAILTAFWGVDGALGPPGSALQCNEIVGARDGMPIVMSAEVTPDTLLGSEIAVELTDGTVNLVACAKREPAGEENEDRTILLIGEFGAPDNPPVAIRIVASIPLEDGTDALGLEITTIAPLADGPSLVVAERVIGAEAEYGAPNDCPADTTTQLIRTIWSGGVDGDQGAELTSAQLGQWTVEVDAGGGTRADVTPIAFGDLGDGDNNVDLCLDDDRTALSVRVVANAVTDPTNDWNAAQAVDVIPE